MNTIAARSSLEVLDDSGRRKYLTKEEQVKFLQAASRLPFAARAFCIILAEIGCRISEALALTMHHVDVERCTVTVRTLKRRRRVFRVVPVPEATIRVLKELQHDEDGRFWPMHRATAWRLVKATMTRAGIVGPMATPKGLRHSFGIRAATSNIPTNLIQRWMGHASPNTTAIYVDAVGLEERQFASRMW